MRFAALIFLAGGLSLLRAAPDLPLHDGEQLIYGVSWAIIPGAGRITVAAHSSVDPLGVPYLRIVTFTETRGLAKLILPFTARAESLYDTKTGRLLWFGESSSTRGKDSAHSMVFNYPKKQAEYQDGAASEPRTLELPEGNPIDLINCLVQARTWDLQPGQARDALVFFEDEFYLLTIHAVRYETVSCFLGESRALLLEPRMEKTPPKGMFRRGSTVKVWIGQDSRRLPLQFQVEFKFGTGIAVLTGYQPAAGAAPLGRVPAPAGRK